MKYQVDCWNCGGMGELEGDCTCQEDVCCCLEPALRRCPTCRGLGYFVVSELTPDNCDFAMPIWEPSDAA